MRYSRRPQQVSTKHFLLARVIQTVDVEWVEVSMKHATQATQATAEARMNVSASRSTADRHDLQGTENAREPFSVRATQGSIECKTLELEANLQVSCASLNYLSSYCKLPDQKKATPVSDCKERC